MRKLWPTCRDYGPDLVRLALIHRQTPPPLHGKAKGEWESLGDLGYLDEAGYLFLSDRRTDLILSGGANIYPAEVEAALEFHPAVACAVVVGLPDADLGQRVDAIIELQKAWRSMRRR